MNLHTDRQFYELFSLNVTLCFFFCTKMSSILLNYFINISSFNNYISDVSKKNKIFIAM